MSEYETYDILIKAVGALVVLIGVPLGLVKYFDTKRKEFYARFWDKRLEYYLRASKAASSIAVSRSDDNSDAARRDFWQLFFGEMSVVEDESVKEAMQSFGGDLELAKAGGKPYSALEQPAYRLSLACRESLRSSWNRPFGL